MGWPFTGYRVLDSIALYLGLALVFVGLVSLIRPVPFIRIRTRRVAAIVAAAGLVFTIVALSVPVQTKRVSTPFSRLDDWMPAWQFDERHTIHVDASPEKVFAAIRAVRADEIRLFRTLIAIRRCGQPGPESILNPSEHKPLLDVATETTFIYLADDPPRELVVGTVVAAPPKGRTSGKLTPEIFRKTLLPGVALATMNFLVTPDGNGGSIVSSETRVSANSAPTVRRFAVYWRIIHPGSDIIRRMWLRAIKLRAEEKVPG
jgi:hypothetical protein